MVLPTVIFTRAIPEVEEVAKVGVFGYWSNQRFAQPLEDKDNVYICLCSKMNLDLKGKWQVVAQKCTCLLYLWHVCGLCRLDEFGCTF